MKNLLIIFIVVLFVSCAGDKAEKESSEVSDSTEKQVVELSEPVEWNHVINWFEIPVLDIDRAVKFYETILDIKMEVISDTAMGGYSMAFFAAIDDSVRVAGALVQMGDFVPSDKGTMVYLNTNPDLSDALSRIEPANGKIIMPKMGIGENNEHGFMAVFLDTEGNKVALHSQN